MHSLLLTEIKHAGHVLTLSGITSATKALLTIWLLGVNGFRAKATDVFMKNQEGKSHFVQWL
jgi:hypothetical protein